MTAATTAPAVSQQCPLRPTRLLDHIQFAARDILLRTCRRDSSLVYGVAHPRESPRRDRAALSLNRSSMDSSNASTCFNRIVNMAHLLTG
jgi:hypothetical protein